MSFPASRLFNFYLLRRLSFAAYSILPTVFVVCDNLSNPPEADESADPINMLAWSDPSPQPIPAQFQHEVFEEKPIGC
jgi:hypothetical protein